MNKIIKIVLVTVVIVISLALFKGYSIFIEAGPNYSDLSKFKLTTNGKVLSFIFNSDKTKIYYLTAPDAQNNFNLYSYKITESETKLVLAIPAKNHQIEKTSHQNSTLALTNSGEIYVFVPSNIAIINPNDDYELIDNYFPSCDFLPIEKGGNCKLEVAKIYKNISDYYASHPNQSVYKVTKPSTQSPKYLLSDGKIRYAVYPDSLSKELKYQRMVLPDENINNLKESQNRKINIIGQGAGHPEIGSVIEIINNKSMDINFKVPESNPFAEDVEKSENFESALDAYIKTSVDISEGSNKAKLYVKGYKLDPVNGYAEERLFLSLNDKTYVLKKFSAAFYFYIPFSKSYFASNGDFVWLDSEGNLYIIN